MVILDRIFSAGADSIRLEVHQPRPDGADFRCVFRLNGGGFDVEKSGMGVDSLQALLLTLERVHVDLLAHRRDTGVPVAWLGMRDLGLPLPANVTAADFDRAPD